MPDRAVAAMECHRLQRYNSIAISLHWLIAFFLIGLLAVGKYMTSLADTDPLRFTLTQWHKSFGIVVMLLATARIFWRLTHKPPALPLSTTAFERIASHATHLAMYLLMVVIPLSGWVMVSASPLNLKTELFGLIPWPHIEVFTNTPGKLSERSVSVHIWLANTLLVLVCLHIVAALFHQFFRKDHLLQRMLVSESHRHNNDLSVALIPGVLLASAFGLYLFATIENRSSSDAVAAVTQAVNEGVAGNPLESSVSFDAIQLGESVTGQFSEVEVQLTLDANNLDAATLSAVVMTASVGTGDSQMDGTIVTQDWFASEQYPQATFTSSSFEQIEAFVFRVTGVLTIREASNALEFDLVMRDGVGSGEFSINRSDFGIGDAGQDEFVEQEVSIRFEVQNAN